MAEDRRIIVEISGSVTMQNDNNDNQPKEEEVKGSLKNIMNVNSSGNVDNTARVLAKYAWQKAGGILQSATTASINRYFSLGENYIAETDYNNIMTTIDKGSSFVTTVATGFAVGGVAGAMVAGVKWGAKEFMSYQNRMSGYYQTLNATNYQTSFDRSRLGLTNEGKGTEN